MGWVIYLLLIITVYLLFGHSVAIAFVAVTGTLWVIAVVVFLIRRLIDEGWFDWPGWQTFAGALVFLGLILVWYVVWYGLALRNI
jgi:hypothetical protein